MTGDPRDYKLDIASLDPAGPSDSSAVSRPYLGIMFDCCQVYQRVYRDAGAREYRGRCPRCGREVRVAVGPGGTSNRFFRAS